MCEIIYLDESSILANSKTYREKMSRDVTTWTAHKY